MSTASRYWNAFSVPVSMTPRERFLWIIVGVSLIGDIVTTFAGLQLGLVETNPAAQGIIESWGVPGMIVLKAGAIAVGLVGRQLVPDEYNALIPAGLALPWVIAVFINIYMITLVT